MTGRTIVKINKAIDKLIAEFQSKGKELPKDRIFPTSMDFNDPPAVEKNFQNVKVKYNK